MQTASRPLRGGVAWSGVLAVNVITAFLYSRYVFFCCSSCSKLSQYFLAHAFEKYVVILKVQFHKEELKLQIRKSWSLQAKSRFISRANRCIHHQMQLLFLVTRFV